MNTSPAESRTERITIRWPSQIREILKKRAKARMRSISAEVRELLTYARNTIDPDHLITIDPYSNEPSTSVSLTPRLRHWLASRAQYNDRTVQVELLSLVTWSVEKIMERDLALLLGADQATPAPE